MNLRFTLAAQSDSELREEIRKIVTTETRRVLAEELSDIVKTELAKLRLTDADSPTINGMIKHHIGDRLDAIIANYAGPNEVRRALASAISNVVTPAVHDIKFLISSKITEQLKS